MSKTSPPRAVRHPAPERVADIADTTAELVDYARRLAAVRRTLGGLRRQEREVPCAPAGPQRPSGAPPRGVKARTPPAARRLPPRVAPTCGYNLACFRRSCRSLSRTRGTPWGCWLDSAESGTGERYRARVASTLSTAGNRHGYSASPVTS